MHFCTPNSTGAQPCDIIACKNGKTVLIDCKTLSKTATAFPKRRIENNQLLAMKKFEKCGNGAGGRCFFAVLHGDKIYMLPLGMIESDTYVDRASVPLFDCYSFDDWERLWNLS